MKETEKIARVLGRRGGLKGGPARAAKLSAAKRKRIARLGGLARQRKIREQAAADKAARKESK